MIKKYEIPQLKILDVINDRLFLLHSSSLFMSVRNPQDLNFRFSIKIGQRFFILSLGWFGCASPGFWDPVMGYPIFQGVSALVQEGWTPFNQEVGVTDCLGLGRDPTASWILTPHNSCDLTPPMRGTQQNWNLVWQEGPYDNHTAPRTNPHPQRGLELILG